MGNERTGTPRVIPRRLPSTRAAMTLAILFVALLSSEALAGPFAKGPFLQQLGPTSVTVKVELDAVGGVTVDVLAAGTDHVVASRTSPAPSAFHALRLDGLTPSTAFDYRVAAGDVVTGHFTTAPEGAKPFRFLVYGDSRNDHAAHAAVVHALETTPSDFLVNTGDMVASGSDAPQWRTFFEIERALLRDRCVFASVGNHELSRGDPAGRAAFERYFAPSGDPSGPLYGSFRWSNTRFFLLNAMDSWTGEERTWLRETLDRAVDEPGLEHRIAVLHHGPFSSGPHGNNRELANGEIVALMRERKVDLVLSGHDHDYERGLGGGLKYVVSGGAGAPLYPRGSYAPETITFESVHHFLEVAVDGERVDVVARRVSGSIIEACGFRGTGDWECVGATPKSKELPASPGLAEPLHPEKEVSARPGSRGCGCRASGPEPDEGRGGVGVFVALAVGAVALRRRARAPVA